MMKIQAIVRGSITLTLKDHLAKEGVTGWKSWEVHDFGSSDGRRTTYRGQEFTEQFARKTAIEVLVADDDADRVVDAIVEAVRSSGGGEGEVLVQPVTRSLRIAQGVVEETRVSDSHSGVTARKSA
jgi:nitrogen regulatory protein P-II 1